MEVYGKTGYVIIDNHSDMRFRLSEKDVEQVLKLKDRITPFDDPFSLFAAVVRNQVTLAPYDLSSIENNMIVVEILDAAKKSAETGKLVKLKKNKND